MERKTCISLDELCSDVPDEFKKYMHYVRAANLGTKPDYTKLRGIFSALFRRRGFEHDYVFDWTIQKYLESLQQPP